MHKNKHAQRKFWYFVLKPNDYLFSSTYHVPYFDIIDYGWSPNTYSKQFQKKENFWIIDVHSGQEKVQFCCQSSKIFEMKETFRHFKMEKKFAFSNGKKFSYILSHQIRTWIELFTFQTSNIYKVELSTKKFPLPFIASSLSSIQYIIVKAFERLKREESAL